MRREPEYTWNVYRTIHYTLTSHKFTALRLVYICGHYNLKRSHPRRLFDSSAGEEAGADIRRHPGYRPQVPGSLGQQQ